MDTSKGYPKTNADHNVEHQSPTPIKTVHTPHSPGPRESIDDSPPASPSSSTSSADETSHVTQAQKHNGQDQRKPVSPSPAHPLQDGGQHNHVPKQINTAHPKNDDTYRPPPITPGEEKATFDRGLLFAGRPVASRSGGSNPGVVSAPLPTVPPMNRNNSYPEPGGRPYPLDHYANNNRPQSHRPTSDMRSAPIYLMPGHQQQGQGSNNHSRTPSPNRSTRTLGSYNTTLNGSQQNLSNHPSNNSLNSQYNGRPFTPPAALRPDSVCSFPDNSPLLAPNVLAAVDARLRAAAASQGNNNVNSSSSSLHNISQPNPRFAGGSGRNSRASSIGPVITHHSIMQNSEAIMSREQLFDVLNKDDDNNGNDTDNDTRYDSNFSLKKPKPEFFSSSAQSSRRNSTCSSAFANSDIELNARSSGPGHNNNNKRPGMVILAGAGASQLGSRTRSGFEKSGLHESFDGQSVKVEKSDWLKSKSRTHRRWKSLCCVIGLLAFAAVVTGITLGFMTRKGKVDGLAPPQYVFWPFSFMPPHFSLSGPSNPSPLPLLTSKNN